MSDWREGLFAGAAPEVRPPPMPAPEPPKPLPHAMHVDSFGNRTGDVVETACGVKPYYRKGDVGILKTLDADGWWLVDFNGYENRKIYKGGCWNVLASDVKKTNKQRRMDHGA